MQIAKYYITDEGMLGLGARLHDVTGHRRVKLYEAQTINKVFGCIKDGPGISQLETVLNDYADMGRLLMPLNGCINPRYRKLSSAIDALGREGYIEKKMEEPSGQQEKLHSQFNLLCQAGAVLGKYPKVFDFHSTKLPVAGMGLGESLEGMSMPMAIVTPLLATSRTASDIHRATGYGYFQVCEVFSALRHLHLLEKDGQNYSLTSQPNKREDVLYALRMCMKRKKECASALKMLASSCENGSRTIIYRPSLEGVAFIRGNNIAKLRRHIVDLFFAERLIADKEYKTLPTVKE